MNREREEGKGSEGRWGDGGWGLGDGGGEVKDWEEDVW